ncbi:MAG TPA: NeuD/PglB/VioB family sugar acetyltransferase [Noviherbaspirillum sp.]
MNEYKGLLILGFGGHARSVADVALAAGFRSLLFVDEHAREDEHFVGHRVQPELPHQLPEGWACFPAAGDNHRRQMQVASILSAGWPLATVISPSATIGAGAIVSPGSFVGHHAHVGPMARIGLAGIVNTGAIVEHECIIGDYVHVSVHATTAGRSRLGDYVFLGAGATVIDGVTVTSNVAVGAGGVVITSIDSSGTYVGVPVRRIKPLS